MLDDDRQDALDVLEDVLLWQLPPTRWAEVEQLIQAMGQAVADGDRAALRQGVTELELLGPVRAASAENPPRQPAQEQVRERINELIHSLVRPRPDPKQVSGDGAGG